MTDIATETDAELWRRAFDPAPIGRSLVVGKDPLATLLLRYLLAVFLVLQTLVVILAVMVLAALVIFILQLVQGVDIANGLGLLATLVGGGGTVYLQTQATRAKKAYEVAKKAYDKAS